MTSLAAPSLWLVICGMIRAPDQRPGRHVFETLLLGDLFVSIKLFRADILQNWQMIGSRSEVLAKSQYLDMRLAQIVHWLEELPCRFAQSQHDSTLSDNARVQFLGPPEHFQGQPILGPRPYDGRQPFDSLQIMIVDIGFRFQDEPESDLFPVEIRGQYFNDNLRIHFPNRAD